MSTNRALSALADTSSLFSPLVKTQYANTPANTAPSFNREVELEKAINRLNLSEPKKPTEK